MRREQIPASPEHEKNFRETFRLRDDVATDPIWQMAYEHAATHKLYPDELNAIGPVLIRNIQEPVFKEWTTIFPGKMGLSWKRGWDGVGTKEEAETEAAKNCNVIAVPLQLFEHIKEIEQRMVKAERVNRENCVRS